MVGGSGGTSTGPKAFVNIIVFDKNYKLLDASWEAVDPAANQVGATPVVPHDYMMREYTAKEEGYMFVYVSNENATLVDVYFDDIAMTHTKGNVVQYNEYYPFGMQAVNSWTRENTTGNNFLGNGGTELNTTSAVYDLFYRNYDPVLGRMNQVDPMASKYSSLTPYNFAFNDPVSFTDPNGADPSNLYNTYAAPISDQHRIMDTGVFGAPYSSGSDGTSSYGSSTVTITNPGFFSATAWAQIGSTVNTLFNNTNSYNGEGVWSVSGGSFSFFSGGQYSGGGSVIAIYGVTVDIIKTTPASMWAKFTLGIIGYNYSRQQQTQRGIEDGERADISLYRVRRENVGWENLLFEYKTGLGPERSVFYQDHPMVQAMKNSYIVRSARRTFEGGGGMAIDYKDVDFDWWNMPGAGYNMTEQFIGSARISISSTKEGMIKYQIDNTTDRNSGSLDKETKSIPRNANQLTPNGSIYQRFIWFEKK